MAQRRIVFALAISLLLHLGFVAAPGWLPGETVKSVPIEATLLPPPKLAAAVQPTPAVVPEKATETKTKPRARLPGEPRPAPSLPEVQAPPPDAPAVAMAEAVEDAEPSGPPQDLAGGDAAAPLPEETADAAAQVSTPPQAPADLFPYHGRVIFEAARGSGGFVVGTAETVWLTQGDRYQFRLYLQTRGLAALFKRIIITYASDGRITGNGFMPFAYRMDQDGQVKESVAFDWERRRVAIVSGKGHGEFDLMEASQDFISAIFQLALFPPAESPTDLWVATGRYYTNRYLQVVGTEEVTTKLGVLRALRVRLGREGEEQLDLWYGLDLRYLPVRIRMIQKDGAINDFQAVSIEYDTGKEKVRLVPPPQAPLPAG